MLAKYTARIFIVSCLLDCFFLANISASEAKFGKEGRSYSEAQWDSLFLQALSILPEQYLPIEYRSRIPEYSPIGCATMILADVHQNFDLFSAEQKALLNKLLQRPGPEALPLTFISSDRRFKIHYTTTGDSAVSGADMDGSGFPDFVEEVALAFENSHDMEVNGLGYRQPPDDAGVDGPEYDIYIVNLRSNFYGFTQPESNPPETRQNDRRSYIVIDNDFSQHFTRGIPGAKVTAAHEYFHAIQFGYRNFSLVNDERYYYELCSVWMEDVVYDDINDYYQYLPTFFRRTDIPFSSFDPIGHYLGEALWNHFLVKKYNDFTLIRRTWELMESEVPVLDAINQTLIERGSSFEEAFSEFAFWNYFTGSRADPINFYNEGAAYPEIVFNGEFELLSDTSVVDSSLSLTHKYYKFTTRSSEEFSITGMLSKPDKWKFEVITRTPGLPPHLRIVNLLTGSNLGFLPGSSEIIVIPVNLQVPDKENLPMSSSNYLTFKFEIRQGPLEFPDENGIFRIFPNPFIIGKHPRIFFDFVPLENEDVEVHIFSSDGRIVKSAHLQDRANSLSKSNFSWDGRNEDHKFVSSGIYLIQLKQGSFLDIKKFAVIRK